VSHNLDCSLRSAIDYCLTGLLSCEIHCPPSSTIVLSYGEITNTLDQSGFISIYGHGSTFTLSSASSPARFMALQSDGTNFIFLKLFDCTFSGFGSDILEGGVFNFNGIDNLQLTNITFSSNIGWRGGAIFRNQLRKCYHRVLYFSIQYCGIWRCDIQ